MASEKEADEGQAQDEELPEEPVPQALTEAQAAPPEVEQKARAPLQMRMPPPLPRSVWPPPVPPEGKSPMASKNVYLEQVVQQQANLEEALRFRMNKQEGAGVAPTPGGYRITGWWRWKTVVVPPNVYAVHTRRGRAEPLHVGLGLSFRFNPYKDAFLLVPAAVQTLLINANCICRERQGIVVQAYVQWIIDDIRTAYRTLDFSDPNDPMRVVKVQLREQAEAAIKDKVATLSIDEILADKQPVIEELTHRLRSVAEGTSEGGGLGLKIVTVQIKEAVVSSTTVWENLQKPFRAERDKIARMAELAARREIAAKELENRRIAETAELETKTHLDKLQQDAERSAIAEHNATEIAKRQAALELQVRSLELRRQQIEQEIAILADETKLDARGAAREKTKAEGEVAVEDLRHAAQAARTARDIELARARREAESVISQGRIAEQLVEKLPQIAEALPRPDELRAVTVNGTGAGGVGAALAELIASVRACAPEIFDRTRDARGDDAGRKAK